MPSYNLWGKDKRTFNSAFNSAHSCRAKSVKISKQRNWAQAKHDGTWSGRSAIKDSGWQEYLRDSIAERKLTKGVLKIFMERHLILCQLLNSTCSEYDQESQQNLLPRVLHRDFRGCTVLPDIPVQPHYSAKRVMNRQGFQSFGDMQYFLSQFSCSYLLQMWEGLATTTKTLPKPMSHNSPK